MLQEGTMPHKMQGKKRSLCEKCLIDEMQDVAQTQSSRTQTETLVYFHEKAPPAIYSYIHQACDCNNLLLRGAFSQKISSTTIRAPSCMAA